MNARQKGAELKRLAKGVRRAVLLGDQAFEMSSIEAARDAFCKWRDDNALGASDLETWDGDVYFMGKRVARITYNGGIEDVVPNCLRGGRKGASR